MRLRLNDIENIYFLARFFKWYSSSKSYRKYLSSRTILQVIFVVKVVSKISIFSHVSSSNIRRQSRIENIYFLARFFKWYSSSKSHRKYLFSRTIFQVIFVVKVASKISIFSHVFSNNIRCQSRIENIYLFARFFK